MTKEQVIAKFFDGKKGIETKKVGEIDALLLISTIEKLEEQTGKQLLSHGDNPLKYLSSAVTVDEIATFFCSSEDSERTARLAIFFETEFISENPQELEKLTQLLASIAGKPMDEDFLSSKMKSLTVENMPECDWEFVIIFAENSVGSSWVGPSFSNVLDDATVLETAKAFIRSLNRKGLDKVVTLPKSESSKPSLRKLEPIADNPEEIQKVIREIAKEAGFEGENLEEFSKTFFINLATEGFGGEYLDILFNVEKQLGYDGPASVKAGDTVYDVAAMFWK